MRRRPTAPARQADECLVHRQRFERHLYQNVMERALCASGGPRRTSPRHSAGAARPRASVGVGPLYNAVVSENRGASRNAPLVLVLSTALHRLSKTILSVCAGVSLDVLEYAYNQNKKSRRLFLSVCACECVDVARV